MALLLFSLGASGASNNNTIIALVNENVITFKSIENQLIDTNSLDEKLEIIDSQIEFILQIEKANQLEVIPSQNDILEVLTQVANNNNITLEQLKSYPEFPSLRLEILNRLTILKLQQIITKDIKFNLTDDEVNINCINTSNKNNVKQIMIAQIIISQVENPDKTDEILNLNKSYVFFTKSAKTATGSLGTQLTANRNLAVDRKNIPLGFPVFINTTNPVTEEPINKLMIAADTGGAIKGKIRADFFFGNGEKARELAGQMKQVGELFILIPNNKIEKKD